MKIHFRFIGSQPKCLLSGFSIIWSIILMLIVFTPAALMAQYTSPIDSTQKNLLGDTTKTYAVPDVPRKFLKWSQYNGNFFSIRLGIVALGDFTAFVQNQNSISQVTKQDNEAELRSVRLILSGSFKFKQPWTYLVSAEFKGFDRSPGDPLFGLTDLSLTIPISKTFGKITFGKTKEPFVYEMVGDAANLPYLERVLSPFFVSRSVGVKISNTELNDRMTWTAGWFNDWWTTGQSYHESGNDFAARITALPYWENDGESYLHLAISSRYSGAEDGMLHYQGRPESNVADYYVDTKSFPGDHSLSYDAELLWDKGPYSVLSEYVYSKASATGIPDPSFYGYSITGSWVITGEERPYDRKVGYARRVMPQGKGGAWELVARYSHVDLTDKTIEGGVLNKLFLGINWWATRYWRTSFGYGLADLNKYSITGTTNMFQVRLQYIY